MAKRITSNTQTFVGASLLAIAVLHSTSMLNVMASSRAGSLPQDRGSLTTRRGRRSTPDSALAYQWKSAGTGQSVPA
ncbi:hypothetical protein FQ185_15520 [Pseudomonas sp. ANT_H12B]|nr:hypothetical protein FQ185_15520 [Pseudomonas sp. ANT_H12B]